MATKQRGGYEVASYTPNGREIRQRRDDGKFEVQPRRDNYWIKCDTLEAAFRAYDPRWDGENHEEIDLR